jgi:hypothetical protein
MSYAGLCDSKGVPRAGRKGAYSEAVATDRVMAARRKTEPPALRRAVWWSDWVLEEAKRKLWVCSSKYKYSRYLRHNYWGVRAYRLGWVLQLHGCNSSWQHIAGESSAVALLWFVGPGKSTPIPALDGTCGEAPNYGWCPMQPTSMAGA